MSLRHVQLGYVVKCATITCVQEGYIAPTTYVGDRLGERPQGAGRGWGAHGQCATFTCVREGYIARTDLLGADRGWGAHGQCATFTCVRGGYIAHVSLRHVQVGHVGNVPQSHVFRRVT